MRKIMLMTTRPAAMEKTLVIKERSLVIRYRSLEVICIMDSILQF
jgi:hypothetical protein